MRARKSGPPSGGACKNSYRPGPVGEVGGGLVVPGFDVPGFDEPGFEPGFEVPGFDPGFEVPGFDPGLEVPGFVELPFGAIPGFDGC